LNVPSPIYFYQWSTRFRLSQYPAQQELAFFPHPCAKILIRAKTPMISAHPKEDICSAFQRNVPTKRLNGRPPNGWSPTIKFYTKQSDGVCRFRKEPSTWCRGRLPERYFTDLWNPAKVALFVNAAEVKQASPGILTRQQLHICGPLTLTSRSRLCHLQWPP